MELITISIRKTNESFHPGKGSRSRRLSLSSSLKSVDLTEKLIIYCCRRLDDKNFCRNRKFNDLDLWKSCSASCFKERGIVWSAMFRDVDFRLMS